MAATPQFPIDFNAIRVALVQIVQGLTGIACIVEERKGQTSVKTPRPELPYCSFKITTPAGKIGSDGFQPTGTSQNPSSVVNFGGVRKMTVSFKAYAETPEQAYGYMTLLEAAFDTDPTQELLRASKIAFWESLGVEDVSLLLTAGYEGRASLDAHFGIPSNFNVDLGEIDTLQVNGNVVAGGTEINVDSTVTGET